MSFLRPTRLIRGFLFDLDGTLMHTDHVHFQAWQAILRPLNKTISEDDYVHIAGRTNQPVLREMFPDMSEEDVQAKSEEKEARFRDLALTQIKPVDGLLRVLDFIDKNDLHKTLVTNAPRENIDFLLKAADITDRFPLERQVLGDECERPKPFPDPYLKGLDVIGCAAEETIAFEDSPAGASAAIAARVATVGILTTQTTPIMQKVGCFHTAVDFSDTQLWKLIQGK